MGYPNDPDPPRSAQRNWRRREARRRKYARRRTLALAILLALLAGTAFGIRWLLARWQDRAEPEPASTTVSLPFTPERFLTGPDLNGDGQPERVALSKAESGNRQVALVTGPAGKEQPIGAAISLPDFPLAIESLPREQNLLIWKGELPRQGEPVKLTVGGAAALEARGGEPDRKAWRLDKEQGLVPIDYYAAAAPTAPPEPTVIVVDKGLNVLWHYEEGKLVQTARVATGRHIEGPAPTQANRQQNLITPTGRFTVSLVALGLPYYKENIPALDPKNPLGTRWIGFNAFPGDNGTIWAIHGTNEPDRVGQWASDGCIRMRNEEVERLYTRVRLGTPIVIQNSLAGG